MFSSFSISISVVVLSQAFIKDSRKAFVEKLFITHASKVMLKILQASTWIENFQMYKLGLEKAKELEIKLPTFAGS